MSLDFIVAYFKYCFHWINFMFLFMLVFRVVGHVYVLIGTLRCS